MIYSPERLAERITAEITRVSAKRERLMQAAKANDVVGKIRPRLSEMDRAMHFAAEARGEYDPVKMLSWLTTLEGFKE